MKTKIIYISGSEIFNMTDVRTAFDTVRRELGLGPDTVLFGVPVDADDALGGQFEKNTANVVADFSATHDIDNEIQTGVMNMDADVIDTETAKKIEPETPVKSKRTRKKVVTVAQEITEEQVPVATPEPAVENNKTDEFIPILSVLGGSDAETVPEPVVASRDKEPIDLQKNDENDDLNNNQIVNFDDPDIEDKIPTVEPEIAKIDISDDTDDSLERLLQSVQSLHEDKDETTPEPAPEPMLDETDLTLEKLANEFAENQDKIVNTTKSSARGGRIGKLKNILPFKKVKHNDSGLMGDLFGWAGVAANDEEFGIPEFFPTAAKK